MSSTIISCTHYINNMPLPVSVDGCVKRMLYVKTRLYALNPPNCEQIKHRIHKLTKSAFANGLIEYNEMMIRQLCANYLMNLVCRS